MKRKKENFGVTYNVWSIEKEKISASEWLRKSKKRKNTLLSGSERPNGEKHASEWLRKSKWRKNTLLSDSERVKGEKNMLLSDSERTKNSGEVTMNSVF